MHYPMSHGCDWRYVAFRHEQGNRYAQEGAELLLRLRQSIMLETHTLADDVGELDAEQRRGNQRLGIGEGRAHQGSGLRRRSYDS